MRKPIKKNIYPGNKKKNYWWSKINGRMIIIMYNNGISKNNKPIRWYNQSSKFRVRDCVEINYESKGWYGNSNIRFKISIVRPNLVWL